MASKRQTDIQRVPPQDYQSEQATLGSILIDPTAIGKVIDLVSAESFYWEKHATIYRLMYRQFEKGEPTDLIAISSILRESDRLDDIGGDIYLSELSQAVPFPRNVDYYAKIVQEKYLLREITTLNEDVSVRAFDPAAKPDEIIDWNMTELIRLQRNDSDQVADALWEISDKRVGWHVTAGMSELNFLLDGGLWEKLLTIIASRPSMGKTALILTMFDALMKAGEKPGMVSLEMSKKQVLLRMISSKTGVPLRRLRMMQISPDEHATVKRAAAEISAMAPMIDDRPGLRAMQIRALAQKWRNMGCRVMFVDHLTEMGLSGDGTKNDEVGYNARQLKAIAKSLDMHVVCAAQLNRGTETRGADAKRATLADLRDSGEIEQAADVVLAPFRESYYKKELRTGDPERAEINILKQRDGDLGTAEVIWNPRFARWEDLPERTVTYQDSEYGDQEGDPF